MEQAGADDPLWLGLWCLSAVTLVVSVLMILSGVDDQTRHLLGFGLVLPWMGLGFARRIRRQGGNVTEWALDLSGPGRAGGAFRHSPRFAVALAAAFGALVFLEVRAEGMSTGLVIFIAVQGAITAFVLAHASWGGAAPPRSAHARQGPPVAVPPAPREPGN